MFLSRYGTKVHLLIRGDSLAASMSSYLSGRLEAAENIRVRYRTEVDALRDDDHLSAVTLRGNGVIAGEERVNTRALFILAGAAPNTDWLAEGVACDAKGDCPDRDAVGMDSPYATSLPGVFAVGDVRAGSVKRVASSVGEGSVVISKVREHVAEQGWRPLRLAGHASARSVAGA